MKTGVLLNIVADKAIIMLNDGSFINHKLQENWNIGDIVLVKTTNRTLFITKILVSCILIFTVVFFAYTSYFEKTSVISIDFNPSIELTLNKYNRVIGEKAYNNESTEILKLVRVRNKKYYAAIESIIQCEESEVYLKKSPYIVLSIFSEVDIISRAIEEKFANFGDKSPDNRFSNLSIDIFMVNSKEFQSSRKNHITAGKYMLVQKLKGISLDISENDYFSKTVVDIKNAIDQVEKIIR